MKKLSLVFVFVMLFVMLFAFSAVAANITKEAEFSMASGGDLCLPEYVIDDNYHTGASNGNVSNWVDYYFEYETGRNITRIRVIYNSIGENMGVCTYEEISTYGNEIICRVKNSNGNQTELKSKNATVVYDSEGKAIYSYIDFVPANDAASWEDIVWINVPTIHSKDEKTCIWEIDIFDDQECTDDTHEFQCDNCNSVLTCNACGLVSEETSHPYLKATCIAPETCILCDATNGDVSTVHVFDDDRNCSTESVCEICKQVVVEAKLHEFDMDTNLCTNEGCDVYFIPGCYEDYELGDTSMMEKWYGDTEVKDENGNYLGGYAGGGNNSFSAIFNNNLTNTGWAGGAAPRYNGEYNMTFFYGQSHLIRNTTIYFNVHSIGGGFDIELSNDGGATWEKVGEFRAVAEQVGTIVPVTIQINKGVGQMANAYRYTWKGSYQTFQVSVVEIDITGSKVLQCNWNEGVITTPATCGKDGEKVITCKSCGDRYKEVIPATGLHSYDDGVITKPATDEEDGIKLHTCTVCGATYEEVITAIQHNYIATVVEPTCTEKGYTVYTCNGECGVENCDKTYIDQNSYVAELGHKYVDEVTKKPTALAQGETTHTCSVCGDSYTSPIDKLSWGDSTITIGQNNIISYTPNYSKDPHANADPAKLFDGVINSTWTQNAGDGWFAPAGSSLLITLDQEYYIISFEYKLWSNWNSATIELLDANGNVVKTFSKGDLSDTSVSEMHKADSLSNAVGVKYVNIKINGAKGDYGQCLAFQELYITAHQHDAEGEKENYVDPTCTTTGSYNMTCSVCGLTSFVEVPALGHEKGSSIVTDPTCTEEGYTTYNCTRCGEEFDDDFVDALGHTEGTAATCTEAAICSVCGESYGEPNGHTEGASATCTLQAVCSVCGESYGDPLGHTMEAATCTVPATCSVCGATEGDPLGHTPKEGEEGVVTEPTCSSVGYTTYVCGVCGESYRADEVPSLEHSYEATEQEDGSVVYTCSVCGDTYTANNALLNGTYIPEFGTIADGSLVFADGKLTAVDPEGNATEYTYVYNITSNTIVSDAPFSIVYTRGMIIINNAAAYVPYTPPLEFVIGNNAIEVTDTWNGTPVLVTVPGKYVLSAAEGEGNAYIMLEYGVEPIDLPYAFEVAAGETVTFVVLTDDYSEDTIDLVLEKEEEIKYEDEFNGTFANGAELIFVFENGALTVTDNTGFFNIGGAYTYGYNAELGEFKLDTDKFTLNVSSGTLFLNGRVPLTVYVPETVTELVLGDNSFTLENVNYRYGEVKVVFKSTKSGTYIITASETGVVIIEGEYGAEMVDLPYSVTLAEGEEFAFIVSSGANVLQTTEDTVVITVAEKPAHECVFDTLVSIEYANGYLAEGVKTYACECGETKEEAAPVIFTFNGYSVKEDGTAMCVGYTVNRDALVAYEAANETTVKFGVVNAGYDNLVNADGKPVNADGTAAEVSKGLVAIKAVEETAYTSFEIKMVSANWAAIADVNVILCAYVIEGEKVSYICGDTASEAAVAVTYNGIVGGNA